MVQHGQLLLPTFLALHKTLRDWDHQKPPYRKKTRVNKKLGDSALEDTLDERILDANDHGEREALEEFRAAYAVKQKDAAEAETVRRKEQEELDNFEMARAEGNVADCGCCFTELAMNRMVHCDSSTLHVRSFLTRWSVTHTDDAAHSLVVLSGLRANDGRDADRTIQARPQLHVH